MNFPFIIVLFEAGMPTFLNFNPIFCILVSVIHGTSYTTCVIRYTTLIDEGVIFTYVCRLLFYTIL